MDAETAARAPPHPSEEDLARDPAAIAGRAHWGARLARLPPYQRAAFWDAVRRCCALAADGHGTHRSGAAAISVARLCHRTSSGQFRNVL
ncbi:hypothetical protein E4V01_15735 [Methylorubrum sp. Q1]|nr:hypothetical protein E4V01_15735 [Methylorubrum sp. Q1]